jgi:precorrin-2/cobalt-factor-2 C20-methyltransferase
MEAFNRKALPGHFYAVGVGPGSPDLMTVRAVNLIRSADVIVAPRSERAKESLALRTIEALIEGQEVIEHVYPMRRDIEETLSSWREVAEVVLERTAQGKSVVQITIGDPLIYSTTCYLLPLLEAMPPESLHVVSGISAFQAAASLLGEALTLQEDRLTLMPGNNMAEVEAALEHAETLVLYKAGRHVNELCDLLTKHGLLDSARVVCYAEIEGRQFVSQRLEEARDGLHGYMTTILIHVGHRTWVEAPVVGNEGRNGADPGRSVV